MNKRHKVLDPRHEVIATLPIADVIIKYDYYIEGKPDLILTSKSEIICLAYINNDLVVVWMIL